MGVISTSHWKEKNRMNENDLHQLNAAARPLYTGANILTPRSSSFLFRSLRLLRAFSRSLRRFSRSFSTSVRGRAREPERPKNHHPRPVEWGASACACACEDESPSEEEVKESESESSGASASAKLVRLVPAPVPVPIPAPVPVPVPVPLPFSTSIPVESL